MKKNKLSIISCLCVCLCLFGSLVFVGCKDKNKNPEPPKPPQLQTSTTINNVKYSINAAMAKYSIRDGAFLNFDISVILNMNNLGVTDFTLAENSIRMVSSNEKFKFESGKYPNSTTWVSSSMVGHTLGVSSLTSITLDTNLNEIRITHQSHQTVIKELESTMFSVYLASDLIGQFYFNVFEK